MTQSRLLPGRPFVEFAHALPGGGFSPYVPLGGDRERESAVVLAGDGFIWNIPRATITVEPGPIAQTLQAVISVDSSRIQRSVARLQASIGRFSGALMRSTSSVEAARASFHRLEPVLTRVSEAFTVAMRAEIAQIAERIQREAFGLPEGGGQAIDDNLTIEQMEAARAAVGGRHLTPERIGDLFGLSSGFVDELTQQWESTRTARPGPHDDQLDALVWGVHPNLHDAQMRDQRRRSPAVPRDGGYLGELYHLETLGLQAQRFAQGPIRRFSERYGYAEGPERNFNAIGGGVHTVAEMQRAMNQRVSIEPPHIQHCACSVCVEGGDGISQLPGVRDPAEVRILSTEYLRRHMVTLGVEAERELARRHSSEFDADYRCRGGTAHQANMIAKVLQRQTRDTEQRAQIEAYRQNPTLDFSDAEHLVSDEARKAARDAATEALIAEFTPGLEGGIEGDDGDDEPDAELVRA